MSSDIVPAEQYSIIQSTSAELQEILSDNLGATGLSRFDLDRIKVPAGGGLQFDIPTLEGETQSATYEGIIVHWQEPRAYWAHSFEESGGGSPPSCSSSDGVIGDGEFGAGSEHNPSGECAKCPMSQWGSAGGDRKGQACKQIRVLYAVRPDSMLPDTIVCPPTSIKPMRQYFLRLAGRSIPFYSVITKLELERTKSGDGITYSRLKPSVAGRLDLEAAAKAKQYGDAIRSAVSTRAVEVLSDFGPNED